MKLDETYATPFVSSLVKGTDNAAINHSQGLMDALSIKLDAMLKELAFRISTLTNGVMDSKEFQKVSLRKIKANPEKIAILLVRRYLQDKEKQLDQGVPI